MQTDVPESRQDNVLPAKSCRSAAALFNYGNILAVLVPPLGLLWLAASMIIYAMNRHHPDPKVGEYTQHAAYRLYGITGFLVAAAIFIPSGGIVYYLVAWGISLLVMLPLSLRDLLRIRRDCWADVYMEEEHAA